MKVLPLHPLSPQNGALSGKDKRSLKDLHRQIRSTRSEYSFEYLGKRTVIILYNKVFLDSMTGKAFWDRDTS